MENNDALQGINMHFSKFSFYLKYSMCLIWAIVYHLGTWGKPAGRKSLHSLGKYALIRP